MNRGRYCCFLKIYLLSLQQHCFILLLFHAPLDTILKIKEEKLESISCLQESSNVNHSDVLVELEAIKGAKSMLDLQLAEAQALLETNNEEFKKYRKEIEQSLGKNVFNLD